MKAWYDFAIFLFLVVGGVAFEEGVQLLYFGMTKRKLKTHHFNFGRYLYLLLFPVLATVAVGIMNDLRLVAVFLTFSLMGTALEWLIGYFYHQIVGQRLWTYHRFSLSGYTSLLSIPLWGFGGVLFWLLAKIFV